MLPYDPAHGRHHAGAGATPSRQTRESGLVPAPAKREQEVLDAYLDDTSGANRRRLDSARERYASLYERAPIGYLTLTPRGRILRANPAAAELFGLEQDHLRGRSLVDLVARDQVHMLEQHMRSALESDKTSRCELRLISPDRHARIVAATLTADGDLKGVPRTVIASLTDMTAYRKLESDLRHAQKMEALGRLAAGVAHDMNNLLMSIMGCADLAARSVEENTRTHCYLTELKRVVQSGAHVVKQLNVWSRKSSSEDAAAPLDDTLSRVEAMLSPLLGDDVTLQVHPAAPGAHVSCSRGSLEQVLLNLALNARDAMPAGGTLSFHTSLAPVDRRGGSRSRWVRLVVGDDGRGMTDSVRERVFEPFFTTKGDTGTGLGLSTVYAIVEQAGGKITVDSEPSRGTTFTIDLPESAGSGTAPAQESRDSSRTPYVEGRGDTLAPRRGGAAGARRSSSLVVLVVEDQPLVRMTARSYLERTGHHVLEAADADAAWRAIDAHEGRVDLLLTDVVLSGGIAGPELAKQLTERFSHLKVVFMSAYPRSFLLSRHCIGEESASLEKPFSRDELQRALAAALASPTVR